jgi:periplasmic copper chaperone A
MPIRRPILLAVFLLISACSGRETASDAGAAAACETGGVAATDAWVRAAAEGGVSAGFVTLCNGAAAADRLVAVRYDGAESVELHVTQVGEDGVARMSPLEGGLALPPGEPTALAPGGSHIMLIGLAAPIEAGETQTLTLEFEHSAPLAVDFEARSRVNAAH